MNDLTSLFEFKAWANAELLASMAMVDARTHGPALRTAIRTMNHIHVVDQIFQAHLRGEPHSFTATNTPGTPTLQRLTASMAVVDAWYIDHASAARPEVLAEPVRFTFTDGDEGRMTRHEILHHVLAHGLYHRGAVGQVLRGIGTAPPRELYTRFLHAIQPSRRERT